MSIKNFISTFSVYFTLKFVSKIKCSFYLSNYSIAYFSNYPTYSVIITEGISILPPVPSRSFNIISLTCSFLSSALLFVKKFNKIILI